MNLLKIYGIVIKTCQGIISKKFPIPIIVVGNITVGGTGKTP